jgi:hypothetical protein
VLALAGLTLGLLAACASSTGTGSGGAGTGGTGGTGSGATRATSLTVRLDAGDGTAPKVWTLTCDPPAGTHPQAAAACAQLAATSGDPFAPTPKGMMCSMIYGGPERATVEGTFDGRAVSTTFARTNGCEVARWERVSALLVVRGSD